MKTAAAYIRVSTDDQIEYSPDSQLKLLREYAKKNDYILPDEFIFSDEGISGRDTKHRPAFNRMIAHAKSDEHPFDVILVWKFSRFARNQEESIVFKNLLRKVGVEVRSISEPVDPNSSYGSLIERIIEWMDEFYSANLAVEVKRGMQERFSRGEIVTTASFGYKVENGNYVPHPEQAPIIRRIFESYAAGVGTRTIARSLAADGIKTNRGNPPDNRFVDYILNNPVYIGKLRWSSEGRAASTRDYKSDKIIIVDGHHTPLIGEELWNTVQQKLEETKKLYPKFQRREQPIGYMLKGLVRCSSCGSTLVMSQSTGSLQCHSYNRGACTTSHSITIKKIEQAVIEALELSVATERFTIKPSEQKTFSELGTDIDKLIAAEHKKLERVKAAYENGADTLEEYAENKKKIQAAIRKLEAEQPKPKKSLNKKAYAKKISSVLTIIKDPDQPPEAKNEALRTIIDHITYVKSDQSLDIVFHL